jgi:hypothetical protein
LRASLGVAVGQELHRALHIGEQYGDLLAFALQGSLGGENLLGEVLGSVDLGRSKSPRGCTLAENSPALTAELLTGRIRGAAGGANGGEPGSTVPAELLAGRVLMLAGGTAHARTSPVGGPRLARAGQESQSWEAHPC